MVNFIKEGDTLTVTAPYAVSAGGGVLVGAIFGIAANDALINATDLEIAREGVFDIAKDANAAGAGKPAYWDDNNKVVTAVPNGTKPVGAFTQAAQAGDATGRVVLNATALQPIFVSTEQTGTGAAQNIAHGLGVVPSFVFVAPTDLTPATVGSYSVVEGVHTNTNVVVTVTTGKKFKVIAFA